MAVVRSDTVDIFKKRIEEYMRSLIKTEYKTILLKTTST